MILVVLAMLSMLAIVALAIDVITLYAAHSETQRVADAAALAAAKTLVDAGVTADPTNAALQTTAQGIAMQVAKDVGRQMAIAGRQVQAADVTVTFPNGGNNPQFAINPTVNVSVVNAFLPTFFSRIFSRTSLTVQASATAEAFNPSNSGSIAGGSGLPVVPRCVKPFILPNCDPGHAGGACGAAATLIDAGTGEITKAGQTPAGVVGESFTLSSACTNAGPGACVVAGSPAAGKYYPANFAAPVGGFSCPSCALGTSNFQDNIECCNPTPLACGTTLTLDTTQVPDKGFGPASNGMQCLIHQQPGSGQDLLNDGLNLGPANAPVTYPLRIQAGINHPLSGGGVAAGDYINSSDSIVSIPIYDWTNPATVTSASSVTVIGFLQVFVNQSNPNGSFDVTVLNVAGCGSGATGTAVAGGGTSAIPIRLIHQ